ncbi:MAG: thioesterase [Acidimicrobiales bacterium]|jgi:fluoroacetyl-CoA thioesterase|nr:thioesterase [Acidimicrobiales bacterium]|tara:strand:+ start:907 stop:1287 length:381 start_codon:yes stop_codon:yes gene_type:complete
MPGLRGHATHTITDADTAIAMRSGEVPTLATPRLVALMEEATVAALADKLGEGETSVGMRIHIDHLSPSGTGAEIMAEALLEAVEGRRLTFGATATEGGTVVATASIVRVVVATDRFVGRVGAETD